MPLSVWELPNCGPADEELNPARVDSPQTARQSVWLVIAGGWGGGGAQLWPPSPVAA